LGSDLAPFLNNGVIDAFFQSLGTSDFLKEDSKISFKHRLASSGISFSSLGLISSGPGALLVSRPSIKALTPEHDISIAGMSGKFR